jgi:hypothetical protein
MTARQPDVPKWIIFSKISTTATEKQPGSRPDSDSATSAKKPDLTGESFIFHEGRFA